MSDKLPWGLTSDGLTPGSMKSISENKLKAFSIGSMNLPKKGMTKKEQEVFKKKEEEAAAAKAYEDFVASFEDTGKLTKTWVKGGLAGDKDGVKSKKGLYKPTSKLAELAATFSTSKKEKEKPPERPPLPSKKKKMEEKRKSNLEIFKEELRQMQEERQERHKLKKQMDDYEEGLNNRRKTRFEPEKPPMTPSELASLRNQIEKDEFKYDTDTETTNLYLGNLNPKLTEQQLCELFGKYGPLASVKVMWPRSEVERSRGRNCGFVAYMNRKDGERALAALKGKDIMTFEMKLGWGKAVPIPPHPVYIPPSMVELTLPPPPSGLPFNAQPRKKRYQDVREDNGEKGYGNVPPPEGQEAPSREENSIEQTISNAVVKVVIPTERTLLCVVHRMIEFVVREGPMFEAMIMNREINNPMYRFLFENQSPAHVYYRWKLFSILQGDTPTKWTTDDFYMFKGGSKWRPPAMNPYTSGMDERLVRDREQTDAGPKKGQLTDSQRDRLEDMLRDMTPERVKVGDAMVWCLDHAEAAEEIVECVQESLSILETPLPKKIARLFLISDILYNSSAKVPNASFFRKYFENKLAEVFRDLHMYYNNIEGRLKAEQFKQKVQSCFRAWEDWTVYPNDFLIRLQNLFLGLTTIKDESSPEPDRDFDVIQPLSEDIDGTPADLDGIPLGGLNKSLVGDYEDVDLDGMPMENKEDLDGQPLEDQNPAPTPAVMKFKPSKWETVDEDDLERQAVTTSKWEMFDAPEEKTKEEDVDGDPMEDDYQDIDGSPMSSSMGHSREGSAGEVYFSRGEMTEERRAKLREVEVKVMKYQDELEAGKRSRKSEYTISQQIQHYRKKLLQKEEEKERKLEKDRQKEKKSDGRRRQDDWERNKDRERERDYREREKRERDPDRRERERDRRERDMHRDRSSSSEPDGPGLVPYSRNSSASPTVQMSGYSYSPESLSLSSRKSRHRSRSRSPKSKRSKSDRRKHRSRSSSPRKYRRSPSPQRSDSRSPSRHKSKHKKRKR
ncbi:unnamed protein product [Owenia fusiformis]|uniref:Uncharacterized protein n=1 Tax=Owenia fusiformis TaxID=6347 RepID=A0A8J1Y9J2_OWEFU|nr:unnamed protein product [Owenia fusiformis]